jgi:uncharacterized membrane protein YraQ (UPF0718 family)
VSDLGNEPSNARHTAGVELMFIFMLPALMIVVAIAAMAATGYWWLMGVVFLGALIVTGLIALTIFNYTGDETEITAVEFELSRSASDRERELTRPQPRRRHHRLALHH